MNYVAGGASLFHLGGDEIGCRVSVSYGPNERQLRAEGQGARRREGIISASVSVSCETIRRVIALLSKIPPIFLDNRGIVWHGLPVRAFLVGRTTSPSVWLAILLGFVEDAQISPMGFCAPSGTGRFQLTTDGLAAHKSNVPYAFGMQVDFAQLIKVYSSTQETTRYSPASIISTEKLPIFGEPDDDNICTSHIECFNLTYRVSLRRYTRLTNAHSKSLRHHTAMQALFVAWYNFGRKHEMLKGKTPAMASGLSDHLWTIKELIEKAA